nr:MAG TPA: hypothetical protein [Caudoviricetes sp.]
MCVEHATIQHIIHIISLFPVSGVDFQHFAQVRIVRAAPLAEVQPVQLVGLTVDSLAPVEVLNQTITVPVVA